LNERAAYAASKFLESGSWRAWGDKEQTEFWKQCEAHKVPIPLPKPKDLGRDIRGREIGNYSVEEYNGYLRVQREIRGLKRESEKFREKRRLGKEITEADFEDERSRRKLIGGLQGNKMGKYEGDPEWDDVVPIPQDDGENALAAIAYTDEYAEGISTLLVPHSKHKLMVCTAMGYLRSVMASQEHSLRVLSLTSHIISLNAAHYTVWLYRASTIFALDSSMASIAAEIEWVNEIALDNQKNYQIWHHRQLLIDHIYSSIRDDRYEVEMLARSEVKFMNEMFEEDSKNYHVWSYRQYLVRKLDLFNMEELRNTEEWLRRDIRNNSAWSHRFFLVFSDPNISTMGSKATEHDPSIPNTIIDREIEFCKAATFEAPQSQSSWNYLRGVLKKGGRKLASQECFVGEFVKLCDEEGNGEDIRSSHALDFMADCWAEQGKKEEADKALMLLGDKYDRIRKNYWEWKRVALKDESMLEDVSKVKLVE
jgi:protein farnesyltransferase/geranylgeranyltransferase type-1 subunit alpha